MCCSSVCLRAPFSKPNLHSSYYYFYLNELLLIAVLLLVKKIYYSNPETRDLLCIYWQIPSISSVFNPFQTRDLLEDPLHLGNLFITV